MEEDIVVSDKDIENVTREVLKKDEEKKRAIEEEMEKRIREKIAKEEEDKRLKEEKAALEAALVQKDKEKKEEIEKLRKELEEVKNQATQSKGIVNTQNPFQGNTQASQIDDRKFVDTLSSDDFDDIDDASRNAWNEYQRNKK